MTQHTPARLPTCTHTSCKPMSSVTIDLAQLDQPLSYVSHPYEYDQIDSCQKQTSADNYHMIISRAQVKEDEYLVTILAMFHRIIFILLIVRSPSRDFYRCTDCFQSNINIACRNTQNAARKYHSLLKITNNKTINSFINKGK